MLMIKVFKAIVIVASIFSVSVNATNIDVGGSTVAVDDSYDAGYGGSIYDVDEMTVSWGADDTITVDVFTKFADQRNNYNGTAYNSNNIYQDGSRGKKIIFGDLLIGANTGNDSGYNYAFSLGSLYSGWNERFSNIDRVEQSIGGLYEISGVKSAGSYHGYSTHRGAVFGQTYGNEINSSLSSWSSTSGKLSFVFSVAGLDVFKRATSLSLDWAMSCFNDSVKGQFAVNRGSDSSVSVPEPATAILMLLAIAGLAYRQRA